jgi:hypothetical protein
MIDFDLQLTCASIGQPRAMHDTSVLFRALARIMKKKFPTHLMV